jgi:hypothetical protein
VDVVDAVVLAVVDVVLVVVGFVMKALLLK